MQKCNICSLQTSTSRHAWIFSRPCLGVWLMDSGLGAIITQLMKLQRGSCDLPERQTERAAAIRLLFKLADYCNYSQQGECARQGWTLTVGPVILGGGIFLLSADCCVWGGSVVCGVFIILKGNQVICFWRLAHSCLSAVISGCDAETLKALI